MVARVPRLGTFVRALCVCVDNYSSCCSLCRLEPLDFFLLLQLRENKPKLFFSRAVNKAWYAVFGAEDIIKVGLLCMVRWCFKLILERTPR